MAQWIELADGELHIAEICSLRHSGMIPFNPNHLDTLCGVIITGGVKRVNLGNALGKGKKIDIKCRERVEQRQKELIQ